MFSTVNCSQQGFGREKDGNCGKFIGYKKFEELALCKSVTQSEATFIA